MTLELLCATFYKTENGNVVEGIESEKVDEKGEERKKEEEMEDIHFKKQGEEQEEGDEKEKGQKLCGNKRRKRILFYTSCRWFCVCLSVCGVFLFFCFFFFTSSFWLLHANEHE